MTKEHFLQHAKALGLYSLEAHYEELTPEQISDLMRFMNWEEDIRQHRSLQRRIAQAKIGTFKSIADFEWSWYKKCDREAVDELMQLKFIEQAINAILLGPNGVGKSTLAKNIAHHALVNGYTVRFITASEMLNDLAAQDSGSALRRRLKHYVNPQLLVIDEIGYLSYGNRHADLLFEIISQRYEKRATLITTNKAFAQWSEVFPNAACVVTLVDRLIHHAEILTFEGES